MFPSHLLSANWTDLLVLNFETDKKFLEHYLPAGLELNDWNGQYFMSLVGFEFSNTKLFGIPSPVHRRFAELNLRFYVKRRIKDQWRKGVVFIKEIAPSWLVGQVAGWLYKESFVALPVKKSMTPLDNKVRIGYTMKINNEQNYLSALATTAAVEYSNDSLEGFILDHYWGYTRVTKILTNEFEVIHRPWKIYPVMSADIKLDIPALYGKEFEPWLARPPQNMFLMDGSETKVTWPRSL